MIKMQRAAHRLLAASLCGIFAAPAALPAGDPLISREELRREVRAISQSRRAHLAQVEKFFHSEAARNALVATPIDAKRVAAAAQLLDDEELARLAARAVALEKDFAAGALSNEHLTYIVIALAAAVLVLILK
jgi:hypothetical protein